MLNGAMSPTNPVHGDRVICQVARPLRVGCPHTWHCSNIPLAEVIRSCYAQ